MRVGLFFIGLVVAGLTAGAQDYRGVAVPVARRADPMEFSRMRFLTFAFGREGPMDTPLQTPTVQGREYFVEADIFGIESAATIRFDLLDAAGRTIRPLTMWKASDGATDGEFYGFLKVPDEPFRVVASGTTTAGMPYRILLSTLFNPRPSGAAEQFLLPAGISADQRTQLESMVDDYRRQLQGRASQAAAENPGGLIVLSRATVSGISYEPLSASGATIGMRLRYTVRFPAQQTLVAVPTVLPVYSTASWRGMVRMKALGGAIEPAPQMVGAQSLQDVLVYDAAATYQAGVTYAFTVDLVPDFVFQGSLSSRFCIYRQQPRNPTVWREIIDSAAPVPYSVSISDTETGATIPSFFPQKTFYDAFVSNGAIDCGPVPNNRF